MSGALFILSGPSGSGKTTLIRRLLDEGELESVSFSVSHTTRRPRVGEKHGRDYHFVSDSEFDGMIAEDRFLEWARVHDHLYGTSLDEVLPKLASGTDVLLDIDVQGAQKVLETDEDRFGEAVFGVFVLPPGYLELKSRLERRNLDAPDVIARRLDVARAEIQRFQNYDYVIINANADRASRVLASIILEKRHDKARIRGQVAAVLASFPEPESALEDGPTDT
ncbi:MAG: guanylate kinase [Acidobacteriota bacterium]|nr:guanylate kinase [Acidobacteriota bacterium]